MADYLNPDSLLTPMGTNSMYAPTYMDMLTSDVQRKLQAQEALRHSNMMSEQDRRAKPWLTEAAISEAKMKSDRDLAMADPAMVEAWKQGQLGGFDEAMAKGKLAKGTVDSEIGVKNAANQFGINQTKYLDEYNKLAKIYQPLQAMVNSGMPSQMIQGNIMRLFKQQGADTDWMNPEYMQALELLSKDPQKLMTVLDNQMGSLMNQAQRFDLTKQREGDLAALERAKLAEAGAANRQKEDNSQVKLQTALLTQKTGQVKAQLSAYQKSISLLRLQYQTAKKEEEKAKYAQMITAEGEAYNQAKAELDFLEQQLLQLSGLQPYKAPAAPAAPTQNIIKLD